MKVNTKELLQQADQLRAVVHKTLDVREDVRRVHGALRTESVGDEFTPALRAAIRDIENQAADLELFWRALRVIANAYEDTEERILDRVEGSGVVFNGYNLKWIPLTDCENIPQVQWEPWNGN